MRPLYRNLFLLFGIVAIGFMAYGFGADFRAQDINLGHAALYLPAVVGIWVVVYAFNAGAFSVIVNSGTHNKHLSYAHACKLTVSGFAFSYTTPFGVGGAPYRVMELSSYIGTPRAMSATVLYSMTHVLSHFFLWMTGVVLFVTLYFARMDAWLWMLAALFTAVFAVVLYFFYYGYRNGMIVRLYGILLHIPLLKKPARRFYDRHVEDMEQVDNNIAALHAQPRAFYGALSLEYLGRLANAWEYFFILHALNLPVGFGDAVLVLAFSSLVGNVLFFLPMQLGAREGSLAAIVDILGFGAPSLGLLASFYTRVREIFWIIVGVLLVKVGNRRIMK